MFIMNSLFIIHVTATSHVVGVVLAVILSHRITQSSSDILTDMWYILHNSVKFVFVSFHGCDTMQ